MKSEEPITAYNATEIGIKARKWQYDFMFWAIVFLSCVALYIMVTSF